MRIGILTGGGDCPGLNAVIRAVTRRALDQECEVTGVLHGWRGLIEGAHRPLSFADISGILPRGGTILKTSRTNPYSIEQGVERVLAGLAGMDALVAIGGEDTLGVAARLHADHQAPIVGVPKTIDNDLSGTDSTFGFDTALSIATEAIDRLHSTAESHDRVMVCEVMGRHAGWIALRSGMAGGADVILIPEQPLTVERCCELIQPRFGEGPLEDSRPPRFANKVGVVVLGSATVAYLAGFGLLGAALGLLVAALALLSAVTGLCAGCEMYKISARLRGLGRGHGHIERIDPGDLGAVFSQNTVVQFTHTLCSDCHRLERRLRDSGRTVVTVDVRERPDLARKYGVGVVPTAVTVDSAGAVLARVA